MRTASKSRLKSRWFRRRFDLLRLEDRTVPTVITFQHGVEGTTDAVPNGFTYLGTQDAEIQSANPNTNFGGITVVSIDRQDGAGERQALLRFDDIFGAGLSQVPIGSTINSAKLTLRIASSSDVNAEMGFYRMKQQWSQDNVTPNTFLPIRGVQTNGIETESSADYTVPDNIITQNNIFADMDLTKSFQAWATGTSNFGWLVDQTGVNGWDFNTSESTTPGNRPKLTIDFTAPAGPGSFKLANSSYSIPEPDTGSATSTVLVTRSGGLGLPSDTVTIDYTIAPISATAGSDYDNTVIAGTLTFLPGVTNQPLQFKILGDTKIEGPETFKITLSNPSKGSVAVADTIVTIADNDLLINEVVANLSNPGASTPAFFADGGYEYVEITGAASATIPLGTYFVAFNSESDTTQVGGIGKAQFVVDLSGKVLGSNGLLIITSDTVTFNYTIPVATTQVKTTLLDANPLTTGGISDDVTSFALVYSPDAADTISFPNSTIGLNTDYDTSVGAYVNDATPFLNDGVLDVTPFVADPFHPTMRTAVLLDSVGGAEGPNGQADRIVSLQRPGVRVTIADQASTTFDGISRFLSDAFSRFTTNREANSAGAWFNGELRGATVIYDQASINYSSASLPPGGQITPGGPNLARGISFDFTSVDVNETAGTVSLTVTRSGDSAIATSVQFTTADGTAKAGVSQDYIFSSGTINFGAGEANDQQTITININNDSDPEGFESFFVNLSTPGAPFALINSQATVRIVDNDASVATFQDGDSTVDYNGTRDVALYGWQANDKLGGDLSMAIDRSDDDPTISSDLEKPNQGLIRFDDIFGTGPGLVPYGSTIYGGFLTFNATDTTNLTTRITAHRMLASWNEFTATFANPAAGITNGITIDDVEARSTPDGLLETPALLGSVDMQLSVDTLQAWANGATNYGWTLQSDSTNGWDFDTSDQIGPGNRPKLTLIYTAPAATGAVRFSDPTFSVNENGVNATLGVQRTGKVTGTDTVTWTITGGTATVIDDYTGPTSGTVTFNTPVVPGDHTQYITIPIVNDGSLETNETIVVTLSGVGITFTRDTATLVIRDNDFVPATPAVLLNEFLVNPSGNDNPFEYAELFGTANAAMGGLYIVTLRGDPDVFTGNADVVIDLSSFKNGTNGYTIAKGASGHTSPVGTTVVTRSLFDTADNFGNASNSFLLIYSPMANIAEGYDFDWANTGTLSLPDGAVVVDAVGFVVPASGGKVYGGNELVQSYTPQALSRVVGDGNVNTQGWFRGNHSGANDSLNYSTSNNTNLPIPNSKLTPGAKNQEPTPPTVTSVVFGDGTNQRSMVKQIVVTFSESVSFVGDVTAAFTVNRSGTGGPNGNVTLTATPATGSASTVTITFSGALTESGGSLIDGLYDLTIGAALISGVNGALDGNNDLIAGGNYVVTGTTANGYFRFYGDSDGDGAVTQDPDFIAFRNAFGPPSTIFDFDDDGAVDQDDFIKFRNNFGGSP